jgi:prepilin-type N-terminal cleavage/methylation domain-containing protein
MKRIPANRTYRSQRAKWGIDGAIPSNSREEGFTLAEIMTAMALFSLVMVGVVYSHVLGLKMFNITSTKLSATFGARAALNQVRDDVRSGKTMYVGSGNRTGFTNVAGNNAREGNALQIYPNANTNVFVRYYLDARAGQLRRARNGGGETVVASYITNQLAFRAEDYAGNTLTNDQNNRVIRLYLEFYQWEFPLAGAGPGAAYDYYRLQTRVTRRTIE